MTKVAMNVTGENQFTDPITPLQGALNKFVRSAYGFLNLSVKFVSGSGSTISLKRKLPEEDSYNEVTTFSSDTETSLFDVESGVQYIIGVETGNYNSGDEIRVRLSK